MAAVLVLTSAVTGCAGFEQETPLSVLAAAEQDMAALDSVRLRTEEYDEGVKETRDLLVTSDGECAGTVTTDGASLEVIRTGGRTWVRPDEGSWPQIFDGPPMSNLADTWVQLDTSALLDRLCDLDDPYLEFVGNPRDLDLENVGTEQLAGVEVVRIRGESDDGVMVSVAVDVDDPHHVLEMELTGADRGHAELYDFDGTVRIKPPDPAHVVHVDDLSATHR
ncbi:hypothetical protein NSZ01_11220 [Nocardioides szechwanensis]|uniref:Lipoprotein LprG n=1 Tax=Nocardioides szechwanensis TaxID=1005944 RepID=A0A1H0CR38_9ACTN|nr:hypothetical protein [Nocardioides szechwanensis]GEP33354.1 hypothetical protein NSZ01_11220 [Nocardioides szechwanensis]SDN60359.1 hypothetical protein SAMN05192576_2504 [Nocardioides szechwanensis]